ncbi:MAG: ABC transporter permease subunit [Streptosporangiales bacterium]|nr:ABC transporter permease subunit [Streptosporangiales bacterium]
MTASTSTTTPDVIRVRVPERSLRQDLRAVNIVLRRELIRFWSDRTRMISSLAQPVLFLFVLGTGLSSLMSGGTAGVDLRTFMFPGVLAMSVMFTALFSAASIVWDREFGFLREMLVAPVSRSAIVVGKCLGGAVVATFQGAVILVLAGLAGVPYAPTLMLVLLGELLLLSFTLTAFGVMMAARIKNMQSFFAIVQMALMPMFFLSGALFPLSGLPSWLGALTRINPLTYAVDPMREAVFGHLDVGADAARMLNTGVTWFGWRVPTALELAMVAAIGVVMLGIAIAQFRRTE